MKFNPKALPITSKALFTIVGGAVLINPVFAQDQPSDELEEVVVTGIRGSLLAVDGDQAQRHRRRRRNFRRGHRQVP